MRTRGFTLIESALLVVVIAILAAFLQVGRRSRYLNHARCTNNLKQIAMSAIQYSDDKRFFPHIRGAKELDGGFDSDTSARVHRALAFYNYCDNPETFICPVSTDVFKPLESPAKMDIRNFFWTGGAPPADLLQSPLYAPPSGGDRPLGAMTDLSYAWTKQLLTTSSASTRILAGDKARLLSDEEKEGGAAPKHAGSAIGNHRDCMLVVCVDAHTMRITPGGDLNTGNIAEEVLRTPPALSGFLGALEDDERWTR